MMHIKIYQIDTSRDGGHEAAFLGLDLLERVTGSTAVNSALYGIVFDGEAACSDLEQVYEMFNLNHPDGFRGRPLSVSDVIEVLESEDTVPGVYFCDSIGFQSIPFKPVQKEQTSMIVVMLEPGKLARVAEIDASLAGMQSVVGGPIEPYCPFGDGVCFIVNEEGKIDGLPLNRAVHDQNGEILDIIAGTAFICDSSGDDFASLTPELQKQLLVKYRYPEQFFRINDTIRAVPMKPQHKGPER